MPRERVELFRVSNTIPKEKIIVLAFEGNDTERIYFSDLKDDVKFENDIIHLYLLIRPKNDTKSAPIHVFNKLKKEIKEEYNLDVADELWMIVDKDNWQNIPEIIELCKNESNFFVALSNPCFELWLLLHIIDIKQFTEQEQNKILDNKKISNSKNYIDRVLGSVVNGGYNKTNPRPERFLPYINDAISRAEDLDDKSEDYPSKLGTHVYKVAKKILNISK
ncbi:MAG TPA: RloB family protein [Mucilaginibacter sp.]|jgi:hypothetical protein